MFGREKADAPATPAQTEAAKIAGKGRATPKRREAQARNRTPLIGAAAPAVPAGATRQERKAIKAAARQQLREQRARAQQGAAAGDAKYLAPRDQGPARAMVRDLVDARRNAGELFLPVAVGSFVLTLIPIPLTRLLGAVLLYGLVLVIMIDSFLLARRVSAAVKAKHGEAAAKGVGMYAAMRGIQFRRGRRPLPRVQRGANLG